MTLLIAFCVGFSIAVAGSIIGYALVALTVRPRNATSGLGRFFARIAPWGRKTARPRVEPFDDPGGYAAHGDWPFVPSDLLKFRSHHDKGDTL